MPIEVVSFLREAGILGGSILLIGALLKGVVLRRGEHDAIVKLKDEDIAELRASLKEALEGWKGATAANERLADAQNASNALMRQMLDERSR
jgi:hypothetical protein